MRILAVTNLYPNPYQPNRATFNRHQFRMLSERYPLRVIAPILWTDERRAHREGKSRLPRGRSIRLDGVIVDHPVYWYTPRILRGWYGRFFSWSVQSRFRKVVAEFMPDIVLASWAYPDGWATVRLARAAGLPVVLKVHGSDVRLVDDVRGRRRGTEEAIRLADGIVAVSQDLGRGVERLGGDPSRIRVIENGVDRSVFRPGDRQEANERVGFRPGVRHLLFVGNLVGVKGIDVLIESCARLPERVGPWELHIVGTGELRAQLEAQTARTGLANRIQFHGSQPHSALADWFRAADLVALASRSEGIPNVLLEAAACGTPFVATNVGGIPEIAHLGASRLVSPNDPSAFAQAVTDSLERPSLPPTIGPRDQREAVADLAEFLKSVLEQVRPGGLAQPLEPMLPRS